MPLLRRENPRISENLSEMAMRLREDEALLWEMAAVSPSVTALREMPAAQRCRVLERFLKDNQVPEPEAEHIALAEAVVFSVKPSAMANLPGGVILRRCYDDLICQREQVGFSPVTLDFPGTAELPELGLRVVCEPATQACNNPDAFAVNACGPLTVRSRQTGDVIRLAGGSRSLKKLMIDRKIPASQRERIPVVCDRDGIVGVWGVGGDVSRLAPKWLIRFIQIES
jgi:tRNA(Ile)-lysidine synthase